jgi:mRNA interferase RelE/StbE
VLELSYELVFSRNADKNLASLDKQTAVRIIEKIESCKETPHHILEKLVGTDYWKLRAGDYRALIKIEEKEKRITVMKVGHRKNVYKKKLF